MYLAWAESHRPLAYFTSGWTWVGMASTGLMITSMIVWWTFVLRYVKTFNMDIRYEVYADISAPARILKLNGDGQELRDAISDFSDLSFLVQTLAWYYALNGTPPLETSVLTMSVTCKVYCLCATANSFSKLAQLGVPQIEQLSITSP
jgi:hypothetical protein